tara:strand:+ start:40 stop:213 length:174 start_codon:yes stop_codon:yes gene_type:complete
MVARWRCVGRVLARVSLGLFAVVAFVVIVFRFAFVVVGVFVVVRISFVGMRGCAWLR